MDSAKSGTAEGQLSLPEDVSRVLNPTDSVPQEEEKEIFALITQDKKCMVDELKMVEAIAHKVITDYSPVLPADKEHILEQSCIIISDLVIKMEETKECVVIVDNSKDLKEEKKSEVEEVSDQGSENQPGSKVAPGCEE